MNLLKGLNSFSSRLYSIHCLWYSIFFTDIDECASNPCLVNEDCTNGLNMYTCACSAGFTGTPCAGKLSSQSRLHTNTYYMKQLLFFIKTQQSFMLQDKSASNSTTRFASPLNQQWTSHNVNLVFKAFLVDFPATYPMFPQFHASLFPTSQLKADSDDNDFHEFTS